MWTPFNRRSQSQPTSSAEGRHPAAAAGVQMDKNGQVVARALGDQRSGSISQSSGSLETHRSSAWPSSCRRCKLTTGVGASRNKQKPICSIASRSNGHGQTNATATLASIKGVTPKPDNENCTNVVLEFSPGVPRHCRADHWLARDGEDPERGDQDRNDHRRRHGGASSLPGPVA